MNFDKLWKLVINPWHFWGDKSRLTGFPTRSLCLTKHEIGSDPTSADPICPFPIHAYRRPGAHLLARYAPAVSANINVNVIIIIINIISISFIKPLWRLPAGVRTNGPVAEVLRFPTINFHGNTLQHVETHMVFGDKHWALKQILQNAVDLSHVCKRHVSPDPFWKPATGAFPKGSSSESSSGATLATSSSISWVANK